MTHDDTERRLQAMVDDLPFVSRRDGASSRRAAILNAARAAVTVDRAATHGDAETTFGRIAALWSARLGLEITPAQVCILLIDLKTARAWGNPEHGDNWVDMAGYAACGGELSGAKP